MLKVTQGAWFQIKKSIHWAFNIFKIILVTIPSLFLNCCANTIPFFSFLSSPYSTPFCIWPVLLCFGFHLWNIIYLFIDCFCGIVFFLHNHVDFLACIVLFHSSSGMKKHFLILSIFKKKNVFRKSSLYLKKCFDFMLSVLI